MPSITTLSQAADAFPIGTRVSVKRRDDEITGTVVSADRFPSDRGAFKIYSIFITVEPDDGSIINGWPVESVSHLVDPKLVELAARWPEGTRVSHAGNTGTVVSAEGYLAEKKRPSGTEYKTALYRPWSTGGSYYVCVKMDAGGYRNGLSESLLDRLDAEPDLSYVLNLVGTAYNVLLDQGHPDAVKIGADMPAIASALGRHAEQYDLRYRRLDGEKIGW
jgi:hypothetical protein